MRRTRWAVLLPCVVTAFTGGACGSGSSGDVAADGPEVTRFAFEGSPSATDRHRTVDVLNERFDVAGLGARAALVDRAGGQVVATVPTHLARQPFLSD